VQLRAVGLELAHDPQHDLGEQARPIGVEEPVERATDPVVVERFHVAGEQLEQTGVIGGGPLRKGIDRLAVGDEVALQG
jgi:hypothetical protein